MEWIPGFEDELAEAMKNPPDERVFRQAIRVVGQHERSEFAPRLEKIALGKTEHERSTRLAAIDALGTIDVTRLETWQVLDELSKDSDGGVAQRAEWALNEYYMMKSAFEEFGDEFL